MLQRSITVSAFFAAALFLVAGRAEATSRQVVLPLSHRLQGILVDLHRPTFLFGKKKLSSGFVATGDGLVVAPAGGLEELEFGQEMKLTWTDSRAAQGWLAWKDLEVGFVVVRPLDPIKPFPAMGWRRGGEPRPGETLFAPGPLTGGQPTLSRAEVTDVRDLTLPSGRRLERVILVTPALGTGPLRSPLLDKEGNLVAMVSTLAPPPGSAPETVVAVPLSAIWPDLAAARHRRPPRPVAQLPAMGRPTYQIGIGVGSGGIRPRIGIGLGGPGGLLSHGGRWNDLDDPRLKRQQEAEDRAKTEALERELEALRQSGGGGQ